MVVGAKPPSAGQVGMTSSTPPAPVPPGQQDDDDWFDLDKYRQAAGVAYEFGKKREEDRGKQERETISRGATEQRASAKQQQEFREKDEARDYAQAQKARRF
mgnify:FL=1|jgi:hypothetical protein